MTPDRVSKDRNGEVLYLWCAYPESSLSEAVTSKCLLLLSEDEHARWRSFRFERHRREYLTTRTLVRTALSQYHPLSPEAWRFQCNAFGKPAANPECGLRFNLSNSPGLAVCLIAQGAEVGVDVEPYAQAEQIAELAPKVFSPLELAQLETLRGHERLDRALTLWTLKEAYTKAKGVGLTLSLNKFSFLFGGAKGIRLELDPDLCEEPGHWRFCLLDHAGHRIALMTERSTVPELHLWQMRPLLAPPAQMPFNAVRWFPAL
jgi:4'-phosphopantetheinyl transferase